jgi:hypothetical protein
VISEQVSYIQRNYQNRGGETMKEKENKLIGWFALLLLPAITMGCSSIRTMTYSPITATVSPTLHATIKVEQAVSPPQALLVTAREIGRLEFVNVDLPLPQGTAAPQLTGVEVCYQIETSNPGSTYITQTRLTEMTTPNQAPILLDDPTDRTALGPTCYQVSNLSLSPRGSLVLGLGVMFGSTDDKILIGGITLMFGQ